MGLRTPDKQLDLADRVELREMAALYGDLIDERDWEGLDRVFTADAVFDMTDIGVGTVEGLEAIRSHMRGARHPLAHHITNVYIESGDPVRLRSRVIGILDDRRAGSGFYRDRVVKTAAGWRIQHRHFRLVRPPSA
jgi:3-phenylpropionate/cinnamic acid dioxygenase small subunit